MIVLWLKVILSVRIHGFIGTSISKYPRYLLSPRNLPLLGELTTKPHPFPAPSSASSHALPFSIPFPSLLPVGGDRFPLTPPFPPTSLAVTCTLRSTFTWMETSILPPVFTSRMADSARMVPTVQTFSRVSRG